MKNALIFTFFIAVSVQIGCRRDPINCQDDQVGTVEMTQTSKNFLPVTAASKLTFFDENGNKMLFQCTSDCVVGTGKVNVEKLCDGTDLQTHFEFLQSDVQKNLKFATNSSIAPVTLDMNQGISNAFVKKRDETALYEYFYASFYDGTTSGAQINLMTDSRNTPANLLTEVTDNLLFRNVGDTVILGKNFTDVVAGIQFEGTPATAKTAFFYAKNKGIVAFVLADGHVFALEKIE
jgi:hypothetical protein